MLATYRTQNIRAIHFQWNRLLNFELCSQRTPTDQTWRALNLHFFHLACSMWANVYLTPTQQKCMSSTNNNDSSMAYTLPDTILDVCILKYLVGSLLPHAIPCIQFIHFQTAFLLINHSPILRLKFEFYFLYCRVFICFGIAAAIFNIYWLFRIFPSQVKRWNRTFSI